MQQEIQEEAKWLCTKVKTNWEEYDFTEKGTILQKRVPKLEFSSSCAIECHNLGTRFVEVREENKWVISKYIRSYHVVYHGHKYQIEVVANIAEGRVNGFQLHVYLVDDDTSKKVWEEDL